MRKIRLLLLAAFCLMFLAAGPALAGFQTATTTLTVAPNPSTVGGNVTLTATVTGGSGTPTGTVTFFDGMTALGAPVTLSGSGVATFTTTAFAAGSHSLTASYSGSQTYAPNTSAPVALVVQQAAPTSIPALGAFGLALLALGLVAFAWRRRHA